MTDDVPAATARAVAAGARLVSEPQQMPWGQTIAYVGDLNGFLVELCTPVTPRDGCLTQPNTWRSAQPSADISITRNGSSTRRMNSSSCGGLTCVPDSMACTWPR